MPNLTPPTTDAIQTTEHPLRRKLKNLIFPPKCILCGSIMEEMTEEVCPKCRKTLPRTNLLADMRYGEHFFACISPLYYRGKLRQSFRRYKFHGQWQYAAQYSRWMMQAMSRAGRDWELDVVTWVPLNLWRRYRRGYDQTQLLAEPLAHFLEKPLVRTLVKRPKRAQSRLGGRQRQKNIQNAFAIHPKADIAGKTVLLIDDLITTGSTLEEAADVLRAAGAERVYCLTLATSERLD